MVLLISDDMYEVFWDGDDIEVQTFIILRLRLPPEFPQFIDLLQTDCICSEDLKYSGDLQYRVTLAAFE